jgi:membrane protein implicated in regulation of membrane protease activity
MAPDIAAPWLQVAGVAAISFVLLMLSLRLLRRNQGPLRDEL